MFWLRRALGFANVNRSDEGNIELPLVQELDEFPDDPTTDTVPKPLQADADVE